MKSALKVVSKEYEDCLGDGVSWELDLKVSNSEYEGPDLNMTYYSQTDGMFSTSLNILGVDNNDCQGLKAYIDGLIKIYDKLIEIKDLEAKLAKAS